MAASPWDPASTSSLRGMLSVSLAAQKSLTNMRTEKNSNTIKRDRVARLQILSDKSTNKQFAHQPFFAPHSQQALPSGTSKKARVMQKRSVGLMPVRTLQSRPYCFRDQLVSFAGKVAKLYYLSVTNFLLCCHICSGRGYIDRGNPRQPHVCLDYCLPQDSGDP